MKFCTLILAWATVVASRGLPARSSWLDDLYKRSDNLEQLGQRLSRDAEIFLPGSDGYNEATTRWSELSKPTVNIVVVPATTNDVAETVKFANSLSLPFLGTFKRLILSIPVHVLMGISAVNGGHGAITTQGYMNYGIQIWLDRLDKVELGCDGKTVKIGGGTLSKKVTDVLWAYGKQTTTGGCECVSMLGPGLGGGHGFLQGRFGLIADNFVSMEVVYADGSINNIDSTSELWWAMQGAGHNFGIVTQVTSKVYDVEYEDWAYQSFIFTGDKVEELYTRINDNLLMNGTQPVDVMNYSFFFFNPDVDPVNVSRDECDSHAIGPILTCSPARHHVLRYPGGRY